MNEVAAYGGFPTRYPHWRYGMEYEHLSKSYEYGLSKIYEMVINNNPSYAYLLEGNSLTDQKLVMAHVYGHCDFFKNNAYFGHTTRKMMDEIANHAARIRRYVARMNRLIGDLVDVTSIDAGKLAIVPVEGDVVALVTEATDTFQAAAGEKGVSLSAEVPAGPLRVPFDHDRLLQVFANLIANAIKFTPSGGHIQVRVEAPPGLVRFCVSDTGVGIPAPMLEAIFERFWQAGKNDRRGMGLGLYISKSIVDAHHGRIWAESELGQGTRVYFTLPVSGAPTLVSKGRSPVRGHARPARRGKGTADRRRRR
jgi:signal transduction histidine kinase